MNARLERFLEELHFAGRTHDADLADRKQRLRNVEPETAQMLSVLVQGIGARRVLELGTSNGYSTVWLADATAEGVLTVECDAGRARQARDTFARAEVEDVIELVEADGGRVLAESPDQASTSCSSTGSDPSTRAGGLICVVRSPRRDSSSLTTSSHADDVREFRAAVDAEEAAGNELARTALGCGHAIGDVPRVADHAHCARLVLDPRTSQRRSQ